MAGQVVDMQGKSFNRLTVVKRESTNKRNEATWLCLCECGVECVVSGRNLRRGGTKSCGCLNTEISNKARTKHGMHKTRVYSSWQHMKSRCTNKNNDEWLNYGGRGITVCSEWLESFEAFHSDMGDRPEGKTIDRIDVNKGYFLDNCRWATGSQQGRNRRKKGKCSTGVIGVSLRSDTGRYEAYIHSNGKKIGLGNHIDFFEACCVRKAAEAFY